QGAGVGLSGCVAEYRSRSPVTTQVIVGHDVPLVRAVVLRRVEAPLVVSGESTTGVAVGVADESVQTASRLFQHQLGAVGIAVADAEEVGIVGTGDAPDVRVE